MALNEIQQINEHINKAKHILITGKQEFDGDTFASGLALYSLLEKLNKKSDLVLVDYNVPKNYEFLPGKNNLNKQLGDLQKLIIKVETSKAKPADLSYENTDNELLIFITARAGILKPEYVSSQTSEYKYDLIIILGSPDLESLGSTYNEQPEFFYQIPIINIDHLPNNEHFGHINLIDLTASSVSEILSDLTKHLGEELIDAEIATCLYTGLTVKTRSFKKPNITPATLRIASQLITLGADREKIIHSLYRTKSVNTLKLWGRALARLQFDQNNHLGYTQITQADFELTGGSPTDIPGILDELISETPQAEIMVIVYEEKSVSKALVYTTPQHNAMLLTKQYEPRGHKQLARIEFPNKNIAELERELIQSIQDNLKNHARE